MGVETKFTFSQSNIFKITNDIRKINKSQIFTIPLWMYVVVMYIIDLLTQF